jgi:non-specific serine/threonine protein kinase
MLLVLDNFEHLLTATPSLDDLLQAAPGLTLLVTSRAPLGLPAEHEAQVLTLALPDLEHLPGPGRLSESPAVALFVRRVGAVRPDFRLTDANAHAVAEICTRLDGLPLAIELAAARARLLAPHEILSRLEHRLPLLSAGPPDAPARQRTLRDTIAWSYDLLDEDAQALFRRLSVFVGGWTVDAAEAVSGVDGLVDVSVLDALTTLVTQNLVLRIDGADGGSRFQMLETVREYAAELLAAVDEERDARSSHLAWSTEFAKRAGSYLRGPDQAAWFQRIDIDYDNLRAALDWADRTGDPTGRGLQIACTLGDQNYWPLRGYHREARAWLSQLIAHAPPQSAEHAIGLSTAGNLAQRQNDYSAAQADLGEAIKIFRALGERQRLAASLRRLGVVPHHLEQFDIARAMFEESATISRELGDTANLVVTLTNLADLAVDQGDHERATRLYEEALAVARERQDPHVIAYCFRGTGNIARAAGRYSEAIDRLREALRLLRPLEDRRCIPLCLEGIACVTVGPNWADRAARLLGATHALQARTGAPSPPAAMTDYQRTVADARKALGTERFEAAWTAGDAMDLGEAVDLALADDLQTDREERRRSDHRRLGSERPGVPLTAREREVVGLIAEGLSNRQIAERLTLSLRTVERHIENVYNRLGCTGKAGRAIVTAYAIRHGLTASA